MNSVKDKTLAEPEAYMVKGAAVVAGAMSPNGESAGPVSSGAAADRHLTRAPWG